MDSRDPVQINAVMSFLQNVAQDDWNPKICDIVALATEYFDPSGSPMEHSNDEADNGEFHEDN